MKVRGVLVTLRRGRESGEAEMKVQGVLVTLRRGRESGMKVQGVLVTLRRGRESGEAEMKVRGVLVTLRRGLGSRERCDHQSWQVVVLLSCVCVCVCVCVVRSPVKYIQCHVAHLSNCGDLAHTCNWYNIPGILLYMYNFSDLLYTPGTPHL